MRHFILLKKDPHNDYVSLDAIFLVLSYICRLCHLPGEQDERHPMNQTILINYGILDIVFDLLSQEVDIELSVKNVYNYWDVSHYICYLFNTESTNIHI